VYLRANPVPQVPAVRDQAPARAGCEHADVLLLDDTDDETAAELPPHVLVHSLSVLNLLLLPPEPM
jgi:hypothetical protein